MLKALITFPRADLARFQLKLDSPSLSLALGWPQAFVDVGPLFQGVSLSMFSSLHLRGLSESGRGPVHLFGRLAHCLPGPPQFRTFRPQVPQAPQLLETALSTRFIFEKLLLPAFCSSSDSETPPAPRPRVNGNPEVAITVPTERSPSDAS